jgi:PIN domain
MISFLLDTNIVIYTMKHRPAQVRAQFIQHDGRMAISTVTLGELVFGAERSSQPSANLAVLDRCGTTFWPTARRAFSRRPADRPLRHDDRRPGALTRAEPGHSQRARILPRAGVADRELALNVKQGSTKRRSP